MNWAIEYQTNSNIHKNYIYIYIYKLKPKYIEFKQYLQIQNLSESIEKKMQWKWKAIEDSTLQNRTWVFENSFLLKVIQNPMLKVQTLPSNIKTNSIETQPQIKITRIKKSSIPKQHATIKTRPNFKLCSNSLGTKYSKT